MLSADFGNLERDTRMIEASEAQWIHIDVLDGVFVPNIAFGFPVMKSIRKASTKTLDVHLMIIEPERYIRRFAEAGAGIITVHAEAVKDIADAAAQIKAAGAKAGISVKPATDVRTLFPYLHLLDVVLIMSVEPGFGGQSFIPSSLDKVRMLRAEIDRQGLETLIEIDGGVSAANAEELFDAGCEALVAGSAIFGAEDPQAEIVKMLKSQPSLK